MQNTIHLASGAVVTPMDYDNPCRFDVIREVHRFDGSRTDFCIISFDEFEEAVAFVGNTEEDYGNDLWVIEVSKRFDTEECVFAAERDEDLGRYLNA